MTNGEIEHPISLLVDIGNTCMKWVWVQAGCGLNARAESTVDEVLATHQVSSIALDTIWQCSVQPAFVHVSNVAGPIVGEILAQWVLQHWGIQAVFHKATRQSAGITNAYEDPEKLGIDRWLAMIAAFNHVQKDICLISFGSATTMDFVNASGNHLGGLIAPGFPLITQALEQLLQTKIPDFSHHAWLNTNTGAALASGRHMLMLSFVKQALIEQPFHGPVYLIFTGGDGRNLLPYFPEAVYLPNLVLEGLKLILEGKAS